METPQTSNIPDVFPEAKPTEEEIFLKKFLNEIVPQFFDAVESTLTDPNSIEKLKDVVAGIDRLWEFSNKADSAICFRDTVNSAFQVGAANRATCILLAAVEGSNMDVLKYALEKLELNPDLEHDNSVPDAGDNSNNNNNNDSEEESNNGDNNNGNDDDSNASPASPSSNSRRSKNSLNKTSPAKTQTAPASEPSVRTQCRNTPLIRAIQNKNVPAVELLVQFGATKNLAFGGSSPDDALKELYAKGFKDEAGRISEILHGKVQGDPVASEDEIKEALACAEDPALLPRLEKLVEDFKHLLNEEIGLDGSENAFTTLLYTACRSGNIDAVVFLVEKGADVRKPAFGGNTCLHVACFRGNLRLVRYLMKTGNADTTAVNCFNEKCISCFRSDVPKKVAQEIIATTKMPDIRAVLRRLKAFANYNNNPNDSLADLLDDLRDVIDMMENPDMLLDVELLSCSNGAAATAPTGPRYTVLLNEVIATGCSPAVEVLLQNDADVNGPYQAQIRYDDQQSAASVTTVVRCAGITALENRPVQSGARRRIGGGGAAAAVATSGDSQQQVDFTSLLASFNLKTLDDQGKLDAKEIPLPLYLACELESAEIGRLLIKYEADEKLILPPNNNNCPPKILDFFEIHVRERTKAEKAFQFITGSRFATNEWLTDYLRNPVGQDRPEDALFPPEGNARKNLLVHAVERSHLFAFDELVALNKFDLAACVPEHPYHKLLHVAASNACDHIVSALLSSGADPEAQNTEGKTPLDLVPPNAASTKKLLEDAIKKLQDERLNKRIAEFCKSLPDRRDPAVNSIFIGAKSFPPTAAGAIGAINNALARAVNEYRNIHLPSTNPISKLFNAALADKVLAANHNKAGVTIENYLALQDPKQLFLENVDAMFARELTPAFESIVPKILAGFRSGISTHLADATSSLDSVKTVMATATALGAADKTTVLHISSSVLPELSTRIHAIARAHWEEIAIKIEKLPRLTFTFVTKFLIPRATQDWTSGSADSRFPSKWHLTNNNNINNNNNNNSAGIIEILGATHFEISSFLNGSIFPEWTNLKLFAPASVKIAAVLAEKKNITPEKKLAQIDAEIIRGLHAASKNAFKLIRDELIASNTNLKDEILASAVATSFFEDCAPKEIAAEWTEAAKKLGEGLFDGLYPIKEPTFLADSKGVRDRVLKHRPLTIKLFAELCKLHEKPPEGTTDECQKLYVKTCNQLTKDDKHLDKATKTVSDLYEYVIRPLQLHGVWRGMPLYAHAPDISDKLANCDVFLVHAGTGSGKSIVMPQWLNHKTPGSRTVITCPRRVAVDNIGKHIRNLYGSSRAGFQVGGSENPCPEGLLQVKTDALFVNDVFSAAHAPGTSGASGHQLSFDNTTLIIDEVHERNPMIDLLILGACFLLKQKTFKNMKLVLASATASGDFFKETARHMDLRFADIEIDVTCPYKITEQAANPLLGDPNAAKDPTSKDYMSNVRPRIAAQDAKDIVQKDPKAKVLVFLPDIREVEAANDFFTNNLTNGKIRSYTLHGRTEDKNMDSNIKQASVVFANNIAETSITIPGLNWVLDFNLSMGCEIDGERNVRKLKVVAATESSCIQRKGRTGRKCQGTYRYYYDKTKWAKDAVVSFDTLPNENLLQMELRARYYFNQSLFAKPISGIESLGRGIQKIRQGLNFDLILASPKELEIAARLNLSPNMYRCLAHALKNGTCPLAILWLSAMIDSRQPVTRSGRLGAHLSTKFGNNGDQGVLLDIFQSFLEEKERVEKSGKKFDEKAMREFCEKSVPQPGAAAVAAAGTGGAAGVVNAVTGAAKNALAKIGAAFGIGNNNNNNNGLAPPPPPPTAPLAGQGMTPSAAAALVTAGNANNNNNNNNNNNATVNAPMKDSPLNHHWYENVAHRVSVLIQIFQGLDKNVDVSKWKGYKQWKWDDIEDALLAGYYENAAAVVGTNLPDRVNPYYYQSYHYLGKLQLTGLGLVNTSIFFQNNNLTQPMYAIFSLLEERASKTFMRFATSVSRSALRKVFDDNKVEIEHSICLVRGQFAKLQTHRGNAAFNYPKCTAETNPANFSAWIKKLPGLENIAIEFRVKGNPIDVSDTLERIAAEVDLAVNGLNPGGNVGAGLPPIVRDDFGRPPASYAMLQRVDGRLAQRFVRATDAGRTDQDLRACIVGNDPMEKGLAICNVLLNKIGLVVKGGFVRDVIVLGSPNFKDFDCEAPKTLYDYRNCDDVLEGIRKRFLNDFGLRFPVRHDNNIGKDVPCLYRDSFCTQYEAGKRRAMATFNDNNGVEIEIVSPWNDAYVPCKVQDFSCNNLMLEPGKTQQLGQVFPIMMTTMDIIRDLLHPQGKRARCCLEPVWRNGGTDGLLKNKTLSSTNTSMSGQGGRIEKFRKQKGFHLVEWCWDDKEKGVVLLHGTGKDVGDKIIASGFRPSGNGALGPGVYASRSLDVVMKYSASRGGNAPVVLQFIAKIDRLRMLPQYNANWQGENPFNGVHRNACFLCMDNGGDEEWCIPDETAAGSSINTKIPPNLIQCIKK